MNSKEYLELFEQLEEDERTSEYFNRGQRRKRQNSGQVERSSPDVLTLLHEQDDTRAGFDFTYHASRYEASWLVDSLGGFYEQKWIKDILRLIRGGKEASVYLATAGDAVNADYIAAKVYRPRQLRNLRKDNLYRVGRDDLDVNGTRIVNEKDLRAIHKRSEFGEELRHQSWIAYEYQSLKTLHTAKADVPEPYAMGNKAILMSYLGDSTAGAPTLNTVNLTLDEAQPLFDRVVQNINLMLSHGIIHADLSAYNILFWDGRITLIDFPQVVVPESNPLAYRIFERDVHRICEYFQRQGLHVNPKQLSEDLWTTHGYRPHTRTYTWNLDAE